MLSVLLASTGTDHPFTEEVSYLLPPESHLGNDPPAGGFLSHTWRQAQAPNDEDGSEDDDSDPFDGLYSQPGQVVAAEHIDDSSDALEFRRCGMKLAALGMNPHTFTPHSLSRISRATRTNQFPQTSNGHELASVLLYDLSLILELRRVSSDVNAVEEHFNSITSLYITRITSTTKDHPGEAFSRHLDVQ
ncbi:hypothetical protein QQX98_006925 [Neonectria punicea]|uniref:Uncharacterized protein n=1 Tax=Neonectria punicea TaxID=979145 RepID=A0ABR1GZH9_9HYPO